MKDPKNGNEDKWVLCADHRKKSLPAYKLRIHHEFEMGGVKFYVHRCPDSQSKFEVTEHETGCVYFNQYFSTAGDAIKFAEGYAKQQDPQSVRSWHQKQLKRTQHYFGTCDNR